MREAGETVPIDEISPEVAPACEGLWQGFWTLHRARGWAAGASRLMPQPFALSEILTWCGLAGEDPEVAVPLLQDLDSRWSDHHYRTMKG